MASNSTTVFTTSPLAGVDLDSKSSTPAHRVLTRTAGTDGRSHVYVLAKAGLGSTATITIGNAGSATAATAGAYNVNTTGGVVTGQYFWAQANSI